MKRSQVRRVLLSAVAGALTLLISAPLLLLGVLLLAGPHASLLPDWLELPVLALAWLLLILLPTLAARWVWRRTV